MLYLWRTVVATRNNVTPAASRHVLRALARFSFRAWRGSRSAPELLPDIGVIPLAVELGVGQHQPNARLLGSRSDDHRQIRGVVPRAASRDLRQHELLIQIHCDHALQPGQRFLPMMMHPLYDKCAHRSLRQARCVDSHTNSLATATLRTAQPTHRLADGLIDGLVGEPEEAIQRVFSGRSQF